MSCRELMRAQDAIAAARADEDAARQAFESAPSARRAAALVRASRRCRDAAHARDVLLEIRGVRKCEDRRLPQDEDADPGRRQPAGGDMELDPVSSSSSSAEEEESDGGQESHAADPPAPAAAPPADAAPPRESSPLPEAEPASPAPGPASPRAPPPPAPSDVPDAEPLAPQQPPLWPARPAAPAEAADCPPPKRFHADTATLPLTPCWAATLSMPDRAVRFSGLHDASLGQDKCSIPKCPGRPAGVKFGNDWRLVSVDPTGPAARYDLLRYAGRVALAVNDFVCSAATPQTVGRAIAASNRLTIEFEPQKVGRGRPMERPLPDDPEVAAAVEAACASAPPGSQIYVVPRPPERRGMGITIEWPSGSITEITSGSPAAQASVPPGYRLCFAARAGCPPPPPGPLAARAELLAAQPGQTFVLCLAPSPLGPPPPQPHKLLIESLTF
eukprot:TRINITY_DN11885_c3_g1_i1.p1 TRINITY_DN11885_c3_g1~~TRINITY_DN11885_c3_g1_i1.p1  ORF type:complete len:445 (+),score=95.91 TRINITY_DN11885_c3_g1_i1:89-1423(+)